MNLLFTITAHRQHQWTLGLPTVIDVNLESSLRSERGSCHFRLNDPTVRAALARFALEDIGFDDVWKDVHSQSLGAYLAFTPTLEPSDPHKTETVQATPKVPTSGTRPCGIPTAPLEAIHTPADGTSHPVCLPPDSPLPSSGTSESSSHGLLLPASQSRRQDPRIRLKDARASMLRALLDVLYDTPGYCTAVPQPSASGSHPQSPSISQCAGPLSSSLSQGAPATMPTTPAGTFQPPSISGDVQGFPCPHCARPFPTRQP